jgi:preprotein translocase subunit SecE
MFSRFLAYIKETKNEMVHKVNWPTPAQTSRSTLLVIAISLGVAFYLGAFDYLFKNILSRLVF